jgi:hypothetical protein
MKYRQHGDALVAHSKIDAIGETLRDSFMHIAINDWELIGRCGNAA